MMAIATEDGGLFTCTGDISRWQAALLCYEEVVALKAAGKLKKSTKREETLEELDSWYTDGSVVGADGYSLPH